MVRAWTDPRIVVISSGVAGGDTDAAAAYDTAAALAPTEPERRYLASQATGLR